ncbi:hypothetical protein N7510_009466 [Penicillium lagena]|uniref:uncharacterized protein n=1 Tax=Penicillium lagena TaxID=94218 RepID=UPI0025413EE9|nr:uncharacterized protein N7510_009466 [Penicillium lagena]KAJ5606685.1 hypothetical protein N7510_009466 [Penicillium lagena]
MALLHTGRDPNATHAADDGVVTRLVLEEGARLRLSGGHRRPIDQARTAYLRSWWNRNRVSDSGGINGAWFGAWLSTWLIVRTCRGPQIRTPVGWAGGGGSGDEFSLSWSLAEPRAKPIHRILDDPVLYRSIDGPPANGRPLPRRAPPGNRSGPMADRFRQNPEAQPPRTNVFCCGILTAAPGLRLERERYARHKHHG